MAKEKASGVADELRTLKVDDILVSGLNPRKSFDEKSIAELAEDLKARGMLEPVVVRPKGDGYELVLGERRLRAAKLARLKDIPARVMQFKDSDILTAMLVENIQRANLSPLEEAQAILDLLKGGMQQKQIAATLHKSESWVSERLDLCYTPALIQPAIDAGIVPVRATRALKQIEKSDKALEYLQQQIHLSQAKGEKLTASQVDSMIETSLDNIEDLDFELYSIDDDIRKKVELASKVYEVADSSEFTDFVQEQWDDWASDELEKCEKCKLYKKTENNYVCLDDSCRKRKIESHLAEVLGLMLKTSQDFKAEQAKEARAAEKGQASGVVNFDDMIYNEYNIFNDKNGPYPDCKNCTEKVYANHYGRKAWSCIKVSCFRKHKNEIERKKREARSAKIEAFRSSKVKPFVTDFLKGETPVKVLLVWHLLAHSGEFNEAQADIKKFSGGKVTAPQGYEGRDKIVDRLLAAYPLDEVLEFAVERTILDFGSQPDYLDPTADAGRVMKTFERLIHVVEHSPQRKGNDTAVAASRAKERAQLKAKAAAIEKRDKAIHKKAKKGA